MIQLPVKFSVLLFVAENKVQVCNKIGGRSTILENFVCHVTSSTYGIGPFNYPPSSESNWVQFAYTRHELSEVLLNFVINRLNATKYLPSSVELCLSYPAEPCFYPYYGFEDLVHGMFQSQIVITSTPGLSFFSCYMVSRGITFSLYLAPFDNFVWIGTVILLVLSSTILSLGFYFFSKKISLVNIILYFIGCLIDEVSNLPQKCMAFLSFKLLSIPWLVIGMLLSSCYISNFITNLNSPLPGERIDSYEKIYCQEETKIRATVDMLRKRYYVRNNLEDENIANFTARRERLGGILLYGFVPILFFYLGEIHHYELQIHGLLPRRSFVLRGKVSPAYATFTVFRDESKGSLVPERIIVFG